MITDHKPLPPIPADAPKLRQSWRHKATGNIYASFGVAYEEATLEHVVIYTRGDIRVLWTRPLAEFMEKFELVE
jgi:hypothetical protein